ncbi:MAG: AAA family ATPase [Gammaproteobacteria bacterium]|nr:AAA family ATPase [Gammaproteobacteria bacterium]
MKGAKKRKTQKKSADHKKTAPPAPESGQDHTHKAARVSDQGAGQPDMRTILENIMNTQKHITAQARKHFGLKRDPFAEIDSIQHFYIGREQRYIFESMIHAAENCGFLAVVGEIGAGKSALFDYLNAYIQMHNSPINVITVFGSLVEFTTRAKRVTPITIADSVIRSLSKERPKSDPEAKSRQAVNLMSRARDDGQTNVIVIDEAHLLHEQTLKALKRFRDTMYGFKRLCGVIMIGQPELQARLEGKYEDDVREVALRCEVANIKPLPICEIDVYLKTKFEYAGVPMARVFDVTAMDALKNHLQIRDKNKKIVNMAYPQIIHNFVSACLNTAMDASYERVDAGLISGIPLYKG